MMRPYPSYNDSGVEWIGEIPSHWEMSVLKYHTSILSGFPFDSKNFSPDSGFPLLRIRDITSGNTKTFYEGDFDEEYIVGNGNLLIGMDGDFNIRWWNNGNVLLNQRCCSIDCDDGLVKKYLYYLLPYDLQIINDLTYYTTVKHLSNGDIYNIKNPLPPLPEQKQIVSFLDDKTPKIDKLIEKTQKKIELLKEKRTYLINHCVTKGLNPNVEMKDSGISWVGEIPKEWNKSKLKYIVPGINVGLVITPSIYYKDDGVIPMISGRNVKPYKIDLSIINKISIEDNEKLKASKIYEGDIITVRDGIPGDSSVVPPELNGINCSSCIIIRKSDLVLPQFLCHIMNSYLGKHQIEQVSYGVGVGHFNVGHIRHFYLFIPPISEQTQIVEYLDEQTQKIDTTIDKETKRIELLKEYRQSLISEVVTGKIDVSDEVVV